MYFLVGEHESLWLGCESVRCSTLLQKKGTHCSGVLRHGGVAVAACIVLRRSSPETRAGERSGDAGSRINLPQIMFDKFRALNKAECLRSWTSGLHLCIRFSSGASGAELADAAENFGSAQSSCGVFVEDVIKYHSAFRCSVCRVLMGNG